MKDKYLFVYLMCFALTLSSCRKSDQVLPDGNYTGTYHTLPPAAVERPVNLSISGNRTFNSTGNPDRLPAGGSGSYKLLEGQVIEFTDQNV